MHASLHQDISWQLWSGNPEYEGKGQPTEFKPILEMLTNKDLFTVNVTDIDVYLLERSLHQIQNNSDSLTTEIKQKLITIFKPRLRTTGKGLTHVDIYNNYAKDFPDIVSEEKSSEVPHKKPRVTYGRPYSNNIEYEEFIKFSKDQHQEFLVQKDVNYKDWRDYENNAIELWIEWTQKDTNTAFICLISLAIIAP